jgi:hypothetical protein
MRRTSIPTPKRKTAGYSGKTLAQKMGVGEGTRIAAIGAPKHYAALLGRSAGSPRKGARYEIVHLFCDRKATLAARIAPAVAAVGEGGALWISWPKKSSPSFVDLTEDGVREIVLPSGFVDVKVAAVDETWSALKFLRRRGR